MHTVFLGIGTNLGEREQNLMQALARLRHFATIEALSPIYVTPPWGVLEQPDFLNLCVQITTALAPLELLARLKQIEQTLGRVASERWGPRLIDIDILLVDDLVFSAETLTIPHAHMRERAFVLVPLNDIAPNLIDPQTKQTIADLTAAVDQSEIQRMVKPLPVWGERTYIMGILNATPDSFSGDGLLNQTDMLATIVAQAERFVAEGADILDIGGESTRPGFEVVTGEMERERVLPAIRAIRAALPNVTISIDTYRAETARQALAAGADWVNDIWGLKQDPDMARVVAGAGCPVVLMHNGRNRPRISADDGAGGYYGYFEYNDLLPDVMRELGESVEMALMAGISAENIILDPGIGFGKTGPQNLELLRRMNELQALGYPILLGASRKGFIGHILGKLSADQRVEGTLATTAIGITRGADIVRVHDVKENVRAAKLADAILRS
ncbi:MAG: dihydropteroate synthase [Candidatus Promineifilaceae bacterium]